MDSLLSQEEINALLKENQDIPPSSDNLAVEDKNTGAELDLTEKDTLGEFANISMGSAATAMSALLGKATSITTPRITITTLEAIQEEYPESYVTVNVNYSKGLKGLNVLVLQMNDATVLVDLMLKKDGDNSPKELSELELSALSEAMNQMMNASTTSLVQLLNKNIEISMPVLNIINFSEDNVLENEDCQDVVKISFDLSIEGLVDSELLQIIPIGFAKQMVAELFSINNIDTSTLVIEEKKEENDYPITTKPTNNNVSTIANPHLKKSNHVEVAPAQFPAFTEGAKTGDVSSSNLDLIMDIGLQLSVELGRTKRKIKEILKMTNGSIIELDKVAGEPVDILINGRLLAKGEVIIIDENFGVRVTDIFSPSERIKTFT